MIPGLDFLSGRNEGFLVKSANASVAQLVEHPPDTRQVEGSTPSARTENIMRSSA